MQRLLALVDSGSLQAVIVAKLDRLSRSLLDFAGLMERARRQGWALVALDLGVDTSTPAGEMMANVLATFAQFERRTPDADAYDLVIVDAPASGHGAALLRTPRTFAEIARVGPIGHQAQTIAQTIADREFTSVLAVSNTAASSASD